MDFQYPETQFYKTQVCVLLKTVILSYVPQSTSEAEGGFFRAWTTLCDSLLLLLQFKKQITTSSMVILWEISCLKDEFSPELTTSSQQQRRVGTGPWELGKFLFPNWMWRRNIFLLRLCCFNHFHVFYYYRVNGLHQWFKHLQCQSSLGLLNHLTFTFYPALPFIQHQVKRSMSYS